MSLKMILVRLISMFAVTKTTFTPTAGTNYAPYGGCYYETYGRFVHLHLGIGGLTANTATRVYTLPEAVRPSSRVFSAGSSGVVSGAVYVEVKETGEVNVVPLNAYCGADAYYIV